ncbi:MAG: phosphatase PAP2 family protein [Oscillospiraceae bacterium]|nr:phosphatase PAP2 family protein [Oscillospiraceae bacterium]
MDIIIAKQRSISIVASFAVFMLTLLLTVSGKMDAINISLTDSIFLIRNPALTLILKVTSEISKWFVYVPIALFLTAVPKLRWKYGIPSAVTLAISASLNTILKLCIAIPRPDTHRLIAETGFGFPSGHAMNGTAFIGICTFLFIQHSTKKRSQKITAAVSAIVFILAVGFSRVYLGVHNPTDVISGYAMGLFLCLCAHTTLIFGCQRKYENGSEKIRTSLSRRTFPWRR